jgi:hypothetical protein
VIQALYDAVFQRDNADKALWQILGSGTYIAFTAALNELAKSESSAAKSENSAAKRETSSTKYAPVLYRLLKERERSMRAVPTQGSHAGPVAESSHSESAGGSASAQNFRMSPEEKPKYVDNLRALQIGFGHPN